MRMGVHLPGAALEKLGVDSAVVSGHSFLIGAATVAAEWGFEDSTVKDMGRWRSNDFQQYIRKDRAKLAHLLAVLARPSKRQSGNNEKHELGQTMNFIKTDHVILTVLKMAACQGYKCEFLDSVPDDLYCKKCTLVAKKLTIAACCGESFCKACIASIKDNKEPCPECGATEFTTFEQIKSQKRINNLQVYCSMKERGCGWSGTLEQLDTHLDPHRDNCQYVDTKCPLNCLKTIPKNNLDDHLAQHCVKRDYVCRHCSFKATYEEVVDTHLPQCKYIPLDCPNRCGATFERDFLEDHMKMCRLEKVECELRGVGCGGRFL